MTKFYVTKTNKKKVLYTEKKERNTTQMVTGKR